MLPKCFEKWIIFRPKTKEEEEEDLKYYLGLGYTKEKYNSTINTRSEAIDILNELDVKNDAAFYEFYSMYTGIDSSENEEVDLLYSLDEIYEDYKQPFHADNYPNITDRYLRISSIEGEGSYFYDKKTDAVYDVDWGEMDDFMAGKLKPIFTSFYAFLEWYYSEEG
ncbi:hypothetical protein [uncultured Gammaproteobacteria bacterium]|jgi:hypothetical protein|uniref:Uncharacterized protein n=2 Tax=sulfur-oxidizing symbionts TaxID=32036 RepID=A0ACA8ZW09_9GAMM|nr:MULTISPECIES: hypothetical protein [sulfur-oxidizing symbionts]CAC9508950.1 hypothetical protein [uncultured Gammaproteobacteria bacterium]CAB5499616.1 hypothetical protein AZO1586R_957 [Bathymodiolus azoricus thioautotrophic gill symbiont]CAB5507949.1 hypothetical protein AZO1586I_2224 [Bathymodiolus thermophilus thioautotrophic gill symbiont]CAC9512307.1 hypothetical protein [uncultured Gammaproteobacteria bacterium]CAC9517241.1 hypothetical protein [uncultured Gammaproteobacteria bacteri